MSVDSIEERERIRNQQRQRRDSKGEFACSLVVVGGNTYFIKQHNTMTSPIASLPGRTKSTAAGMNETNNRSITKINIPTSLRRIKDCAFPIAKNETLTTVQRKKHSSVHINSILVVDVIVVDSGYSK